jgi:hypothetical protein
VHTEGALAPELKLLKPRAIFPSLSESITVCPLVKHFSYFGGYLAHPVADLAPQRLLFLHHDR